MYHWEMSETDLPTRRPLQNWLRNSTISVVSPKSTRQTLFLMTPLVAMTSTTTVRAPAGTISTRLTCTVLGVMVVETVAHLV